ncbi:MAG: hypothetical protein Q9219_002686 [cf. Caloplaca sp. 3 TL-2023]
MADAALEPAPAPAPALPDYLLDPNAVLKDAAEWRYGKPPDYSNTRKVWQETKHHTHPALSLPSLVSNLVKNWEIEASFKPSLASWRTVSPTKYTFAINGGVPQSAEHMLKVGTYNAIITEPNDFYSPRTADFASSHKTFKRMMPTFAWEVVEVYSGPPAVAFRWRHWGEMRGDYVGFNDKAEKITIPAHNQAISIQGLTIATLSPDFQIEKLETWFDPLDMFRQIAPHGIGNTKIIGSEGMKDPGKEEEKGSDGKGGKEAVAELMERLKVEPGNAIAAEEGSVEAKEAREEMGIVREGECPFMNAE